MRSDESKSDLMTFHRVGSSGTAVPKPRRRWVSRVLIPGGVVLVCVLLLAYTARDSLRPVTEVRVVRVIGKAASQATGSVTVQAPGWVEADPYTIYVSGLAAGVVDEVLVLEGQVVKKGEVVVTLIEDDARLALERAEAELSSRQAELPLYEAAATAAQTDWDNPISLDQAVAVARAQLEESKAELDRLSSELVMQQAKLGELEDNYGRLLSLLPNASAELEVKQMEFRVAGQKALVEATQKQQEVVGAQIRRFEADLAAARRHRELRIEERKALDGTRAEVAMRKAQVRMAEVGAAEARLRLERMKIRAQADGIVMRRLASPGSKVMLEGDMKESAHVIYLYDPQKLQVRVDVPLADAAAVGVGQKAKVVVDVLPEKEFDGQVSRIVHEANLEKNTLEVKVALENPTEELKPEMLARIKFLAKVTKATEGAAALSVYVPERLLQDRAGDKARVWLVTVESNARRQEITLGGGRQDGWVEVVSGLNLGDMVIGEPTGGLKEGQKVHVAGEITI